MGFSFPNTGGEAVSSLTLTAGGRGGYRGSPDRLGDVNNERSDHRAAAPRSGAARYKSSGRMQYIQKIVFRKPRLLIRSQSSMAGENFMAPDLFTIQSFTAESLRRREGGRRRHLLPHRLCRIAKFQIFDLKSSICKRRQARHNCHGPWSIVHGRTRKSLPPLVDSASEPVVQRRLDADGVAVGLVHIKGLPVGQFQSQLDGVVDVVEHVAEQAAVAQSGRPRPGRGSPDRPWCNRCRTASPATGRS